MSELAIQVENLSKRYQIGQLHRRNDTLRDALMARLPRPGHTSRVATHSSRQKGEPFWALKDVTFSIKRGEVVGVIGRNGAGKSTLLKILSRITEPSRGKATIHGRVGSLLEVGTGFHPELTGRENIYLSGTILGMKRAEIDRKLHEIIDFSGIESFIDTPVKRYSSGMNVRLGFAVAAHLEPEILLVDEVLAVGDAEFQRKCLGKMGQVAGEGRTVLFVSHNMAAVNSLCPRSVLLECGQLAFDGSTGECIDTYAHLTEGTKKSSWMRHSPGLSPLDIQQVVVNLEGQQPDLTLGIEMILSSTGPHKPAFVAFDLLNRAGTAIMQILPSIKPFIEDRPGLHRVTLQVDLPPLIPGNYNLTAWVGSHNTQTLDMVENCVSFNIEASPTKGRTYPHTIDHGYIVPKSTLDYTVG